MKTLSTVYMNIKSISKLLVIIVVSVLFFSATKGKKEKKYIVYDASFRKVEIDLCNSNQVVILRSFIECKDCLPAIIKKHPDKDVVIVSLEEKDKNVVRINDYKLKKELKEFNIKNFYYQFYEKNNQYRPHKRNKLFNDFNYKESPILLIPREDCSIKIIKPSDLGLN